jgi:hypothetical protein
LFNDRHRFHDVMLSRIIQRACHAIAIDERRSAFPVTPFETKAAEQAATVQQLWFAGDHGCVGGGKRGSESRGLYDGTFVWMMKRAEEAGLAVDPKALDAPACKPDPLDRFDARILKKWWHPAQWAYLLLGPGDRACPPGIEALHESVKRRWRDDPGYRPKPLAPLASQLDAQQ